jgi:hypothetical protein
MSGLRRRVVTIGTAACARGISILAASLDKAGWDLDAAPLRVYVPAGDPLQEAALPGCEVVRARRWWRGTMMEECRNQAALLKPLIMAGDDFEDGVSVLYLDGADMLVLENPAELLEEFERSGAEVGARAFPAGHKLHGQALAENLEGVTVSHELHLSRVFRKVYAVRDAYYNNGMILWRAGEFARMWGRLWMAYELLEMATGLRSMGRENANNRLVGDQHVFNLIRRQAGDARWFDADLRWNSRGGKCVHGMMIAGGKVWDPDFPEEPMAIVHASGPHKLPDELVELGTSGSRFPVIEGGTGLARDQDVTVYHFPLREAAAV